MTDVGLIDGYKYGTFRHQHMFGKSNLPGKIDILGHASKEVAKCNVIALALTIAQEAFIKYCILLLEIVQHKFIMSPYVI